MKFGIWSMRKLCERRKLKDIDTMFNELVTMIQGKEATIDYMTELTKDLLWAAHLHATDNDASDKVIYDWMDECGGIMALGSMEFMGFFTYIARSIAVSTANQELTQATPEDGKKKDSNIGTTAPLER